MGIQVCRGLWDEDPCPQSSRGVQCSVVNIALNAGSPASSERGTGSRELAVRESGNTDRSGENLVPGGKGFAWPDTAQGPRALLQ